MLPQKTNDLLSSNTLQEGSTNTAAGDACHDHVGKPAEPGGMLSYLSIIKTLWHYFIKNSIAYLITSSTLLNKVLPSTKCFSFVEDICNSLTFLGCECFLTKKIQPLPLKLYKYDAQDPSSTTTFHFQPL